MLKSINIFLFCLALNTGLSGCDATKKEYSINNKEINLAVEPPEILPGAYQTQQYLPLLKDKNVGVIVNQTSRIGQTHLVDSLLRMGIQIKVIFSPEHGFRGTADAGEKVDDTRDSKTGLPVISLYGNKKKPQAKDLKGLDVMLFDIQDVGVRFYTYISTLHYVMEAAAENNLPLIVLDRPNPNGHYMDGPMLEPNYKSFIGMHPVPVVYGMTIGEYAQMINGEMWLESKQKCNLEVVSCIGYTHDSFYELPVKPSPNLPNARSVLLYPSLCFFEGTTLSVGRGTDKQFQVAGHPALKSEFSFTPSPNEGAKDPVHNGVRCFGKDFSNLNVQSLFQKPGLDLFYLMEYYKQLTAQDEKFFLDNLFFDKLAGTDKLRKQIIDGMDEKAIRKSWEDGINAFKRIRGKYLLYP